MPARQGGYIFPFNETVFAEIFARYSFTSCNFFKPKKYLWLTGFDKNRYEVCPCLHNVHAKVIYATFASCDAFVELLLSSSICCNLSCYMAWWRGTCHAACRSGGVQFTARFYDRQSSGGMVAMPHRRMCCGCVSGWLLKRIHIWNRPWKPTFYWWAYTAHSLRGI